MQVRIEGVGEGDLLEIQRDCDYLVSVNTEHTTVAQYKNLQDNVALIGEGLEAAFPGRRFKFLLGSYPIEIFEIGRRARVE